VCYSTLFNNSWKKIERSFGITNAEVFENRAAKRVFPREQSLVLSGSSDGAKISEMTFSLVPSWSNTQTVKWSTYNARMERVSPKTGRPERIYQVPSWKESFGQKHCLIPIDKFYEACTDGGTASGFEVSFSQESGPLFAAGIFSDWSGPGLEHAPLFSYAIITTEPSSFIRDVGHDRMPAFLSESNAKRWLFDEFETSILAFDFLKDSVFHPDLDFEKVRKLKS